MGEGNKPMDVDSSGDSNCNNQSSKETLFVVPECGTSGKGLPYAPEGWPCPGDVWTWRVGKRKSVSGYWQDRSVHPPGRLQNADGSKLAPFYSRVSFEQYIRKEYPEADIDAFFASFSWRIPHTALKPKEEMGRGAPETLVDNGCSKSEPGIQLGTCKTGNKMCTVRTKTRGFALAAKSCDICCSEIGFCRDCCCILCCKTVDSIYGGYSFIRCEATVDEKFICGHVAHMECALRAYMAGKVGGNINLDAQYYCRRCDNKTDLLSHVSKLMVTCESLDSRNDIAEMLNIGLCVLRGSEQERAKTLQSRIASILAKLKHGVSLDDAWREEENNLTHTAEITDNNSIDPQDGYAIDRTAQDDLFITSDNRNVSVKLEDKIDRVLQELKKSQESEYRVAEQKLYAQKDLLLSLYQLLEAERSELANPLIVPSKPDELLNNVLNRVDQIKLEEAKLKQMLRIAKGFGETPKIVLNECFGLSTDD